MVLNAVDLLLDEPLVRHDGPSTVIATLNEQQAETRRVLHLLHYVPERRGGQFDTIEDVIPLHDLAVSVEPGRKVKTVRRVPEGEALGFTQNAGRVEFTLPRLVGHQMIELA